MADSSWVSAAQHLIVPSLPAADEGWGSRIEDVLARPDVIRPHFQPLVDLERGVVAGYEMLARFDHPLGGSPAEWFGAASELGSVGHLDAAMLSLARRSLRSLPPNTFLSVNVTGAGITSEPVLSEITRGPRLEPLVIEITEQSEIHDFERLAASAALMRERGAMLAIDDAGAGYSGLQRILSVRPQFIKLDRSLITDIHGDEAKAAAIEMMGALAGRMDAWIVAEGVERLGELERLLQMRVPLAQGYLFAEPGPDFEQLDASWASHVPTGREDEGSLTGLIERVQPAMAAADREELGWRFGEDPALEHLPVIDADEKVVSLVDRSAFLFGEHGRTAPMRVGPTAATADLLRRAMARPRRERLAPVVCCDAFGRYLGIVRVERLVDAVVT
jgi:EAL domain-containing protein (putative c-di-GMP-specific phosphodiesterase class I)